MIVAEHLSKFFGQTKAVDDISFTASEGENFVFLGTSGCGKTTTLRMINRLIEPTSGSVQVNGENVLAQQPEKLRRSIGYVLQHNGLFPHYTVAENIAVVPKLLGMPATHIQKRTVELMEKLHLPPAVYLHMYPSQLSGGQQQRVGLARALAADPPVLLMDEPFGALDTITRSAIRKELSELDEFKRKTILLVTHDVQEAFALADKICLMDKGKIVQMGSPAELIFHPVNQFVTDFLKEEKMQLSFRSVKLKQLWNSFPGLTDQAPTFTVPAETTVWDMMEILYAQKEKDTLFSLGTGTAYKPKQIDLTNLINAINQVQTSQPAAKAIS